MSKKWGGNFFDDEILKHIPKEHRKFLTGLNDDPFPQYPFHEDIYGPIKVGITPVTRAVFGLYHTEINQHIACVGRSGSGKTTVNRNLLLQLHPTIPCWSIDFKKDSRQLLPYAPDLIIIRWRSLKINPLR